MAEIKINIDGQDVTTDSNRTILEVARSQGIDIPTLCHDPRLKPFTSCFVCVVEVEGARGFVPSCATKVTDNMVIRTGTPAVMEARKTALELIVSNHYADCLGPCKVTCPANVDVQGYIALLAMGKYREAVGLIKETNPFPSVCGRVCTRPCEGVCRRNLADEPVGIDYLKRYAADLDRECGHPFTAQTKPANNHRVAVVGGGPAGMTAAYYLRLEGYDVTVFEAHEKAGGWLRYGIPPYRLPDDVLDYEIDSILKLGVTLKTNQVLGRDFSLEGLLDQGYESVFLGLGAQASTSMRIEGEDADGTMSGIDFLEQVNAGNISSIKGRVVVVGGGNTAVDAARTSLRLGADEVIVVYRRSREEMPAHHLEIEEMEHEGVKMELLTNPIQFNLGANGRITGMTCVRMELGEPDASGRRRPVPIEGSEFDISADWVFLAIGQKADLTCLENSRYNNLLQISRWGTFEVESETMATNIPGIFAGGDVVTGAATAIEAIAAGKKAANAIHRFITGSELPRVTAEFVSQKTNLKKSLTADDIRIKGPEQRRAIPTLPVEERLKGFVEVELGYSPELAAEEVQRCLECGCTAFFECDLQQHSTTYQAHQDHYVGTYQDTPVDDAHPFLRLDFNKCILCGRCVRICDEVVGASALGFVDRGFDARIKPALDKPLLETTCISCGQCADTCPTGAITVSIDTPKPGPFKLSGIPSVCNFCSVGCGIEVEALGDKVVRVRSNHDNPVNDGGNLCRSGRFGYRVLNTPRRLTRPLVRKNGQLTETTWDEALAVVHDRLGPLVKNEDKDQLVVLAGSRLTNEEAYLLQKLARTALKTPHVLSSSASRLVSGEQAAPTLPTADYSRLDSSRFILAVGIDSLNTYPILDFKLQRAARSEDQTVFYLNPTPGFLGSHAQRWLPLAAEKTGAFCRALFAEAMARLSLEKSLEGMSELQLDSISGVDALREFGLSPAEIDTLISGLSSGDATVVYDLETADADTVAFLHNMAVLVGAAGNRLGLLPMVGRSNSRGVLEMGIHPAFLPGWQKVSDDTARIRFEQAWDSRLPTHPGMSFKAFIDALDRKDVKGVLVFGDDPVGCQPEGLSLDKKLTGVDTLVVVDLFLTPTAQLAEVVLPACAWTELNGTLLNAERRLQRVSAAVPPAAGRNSLELMSDLGRMFGDATCPGDIHSLWGEMASIIPTWSDVIPADLDTAGAILPDPVERDTLIAPPAAGTPPEPVMAHHGDALTREWSEMLTQLGIRSS